MFIIVTICCERLLINYLNTRKTEESYMCRIDAGGVYVVCA